MQLRGRRSMVSLALLLLCSVWAAGANATLPSVEVLVELPGDGRGIGRQSWFALQEANGALYSRSGAGSDSYVERFELADGRYTQIGGPLPGATGVPRGGLWLAAADGYLYALHAEHHDTQEADYSLKRFAVGADSWETVAVIGSVRADAHYRSIPTGTLQEGSDGRLYAITPLHADIGAGIRNRIWSIARDGTDFREHQVGSPEQGEDPLLFLRGSDARFYGVMRSGGEHGNGVVFRLAGDGSNYERLHDFTADAGALASDEFRGMVSRQLVEHDGWLYGIRHGGGAGDGGLLYRLRLDGSDYHVVHEFGPQLSGTDGANIDGRHPRALAVAADGHLYGVAMRGGVKGGGTVFRLHRQQGFQPLFAFEGRRPGDRNPTVNATGIWPTELMQASNGVLYGRTQRGGYGGVAPDALCRVADAPLAQACDGGVIFRFEPGDELPAFDIEPQLTFNIIARWVSDAFTREVPVELAGDLVQDFHRLQLRWGGQRIRDCVASSTQPGSTWNGARAITFGAQTEAHAPVSAAGTFTYSLRCITDDEAAQPLERSIVVVVQPKDLPEQRLTGGGSTSGLALLCLAMLGLCRHFMNQTQLRSGR